VGLPTQPFTKSPKQALPSITAVAVWQNLGFAVIIFLAGIQQIPGLYYEAARIDGANSWQLFWRITLPLLNPIIVYLTVLGTISYLRLFALVQNMSPQGTGGPLKSTTTVVLEVYREGFSSYKMGYAGALTVLLFLLILLITIIQLRFISRRVEY
jgi:multiple sugar transport system permease protein